jgi:hypothetical protein
MPTNLTKAIRRYRKNGKGLDAIMQHIILKAYAFAKQNRYCREDDCADFLLSFYPRIEASIRRYRASAMDFEAYLKNCFIWHMKSYLATRIRKKRQEKIIYSESCGELLRGEAAIWEIHEEEAESLIIPESDEQNQEAMLDSLKIFLLALKCANDINDRLISRIASRIGTHSAVVFHCIEILRTTMGRRTRRIQVLQEKRRRNYFRLRYFLELQRNCRDKFYAEKLEGQIRKEKRRYETVSRILAITPKSPSHSDIARILGLPKGTIDSGYFYIRRLQDGKKTDMPDFE